MRNSASSCPVNHHETVSQFLGQQGFGLCSSLFLPVSEPLDGCVARVCGHSDYGMHS